MIPLPDIKISPCADNKTTTETDVIEDGYEEGDRFLFDDNNLKLPTASYPLSGYGRGSNYLSPLFDAEFQRFIERESCFNFLNDDDDDGDEDAKEDTELLSSMTSQSTLSEMMNFEQLNDQSSPDRHQGQASLEKKNDLKTDRRFSVAAVAAEQLSRAALDKKISTIVAAHPPPMKQTGPVAVARRIFYAVFGNDKV